MLGHVLSSTTTHRESKTFRKAKMCQRKRSVKAVISPKHSFLIKHHSLPGGGSGGGGWVGEKRKTSGSPKHHSLKTEGRLLIATQQQFSLTASVPRDWNMFPEGKRSPWEDERGSRFLVEVPPSAQYTCFMV